MTDRELLKLAAKAAGYVIEIDRPYNEAKESYLAHGIEPYAVEWNPLENDGDALQLAVKLRISILLAQTPSIAPEVAYCLTSDLDGELQYKTGVNYDPCAATRRAIVRAAAEIGRSIE